jgi:hypothetical protein
MKRDLREKERERRTSKRRKKRGLRVAEYFLYLYINK